MRPITIHGAGAQPDDDTQDELPYEVLLQERNYLSDKCEQLEQENRVLRVSLSQLDEVDIEMTEEQADAFASSLKETLNTLSYSELCAYYTKDMLMSLPITIRYLIGVALVNCCAQQGKPGLDVWNELITKQGAL
jgi:hypothetical protein